MNMSTVYRLGIAAVLSIGVGVAIVRAQQTASRVPMRPIEPIAAILDAFRSHQLVALGETHGTVGIHQFRLSLIRDPRFPTVVNDIVVEFGNARYQDVMDRFIRGETVSDDAIRRAWLDTAMDNVPWRYPIYEEFFRAVRDVNSGLPIERKLRVVLGDSPATSEVRGTEEDRAVYRKEWLQQRDSYAEDVIRREVLSKQRRTLLIWGNDHVVHDLGWPLIGRLENLEGIRVYTISGSAIGDPRILQADAVSWPIPSFVETRGTIPGSMDKTQYAELGGSGLPGQSTLLEDRFDAILYTGPPRR